MAKGIKMSSARLISDNSIIKISEVNKKHRNNLKCRFCEVPLTYTEGHIRNEKVIERFFKLHSHKHHQVDCKYQISNLINVLVKSSKDIEKEKNVFENKQGKHVFRLNIITNVINSLEEKNNPKGELNKFKYSSIKNYITSNEVLTSYLKSAMGVARLYALINDSESKKELKNSIYIYDEKKKINWNNFFFEPKRHYLLASKQLYYPIAIVVQFKPPNKGDKHLRCYSTDKIILNGEEKILIPNIWFKKNNNSLTKNIKYRTDYVIISKVNVSSKGKYLNLNMNVNHKGQISKLLKE